MYKDKKIIFKLEDEQNIGIFLQYEDFKDNGEAGFQIKEKQIGHIQTPSGTGGIYTNAIQVCGISEAFGFWGCGLYAKPKIRPANDYTFRKYYCDEKGNPIMEQVKDIQLYFDEDTVRHNIENFSDIDCSRCYNEDCSCENDKMSSNAFIVKRADDIYDLERVRDKND